MTKAKEMTVAIHSKIHATMRHHQGRLFFFFFLPNAANKACSLRLLTNVKQKADGEGWGLTDS